MTDFLRKFMRQTPEGRAFERYQDNWPWPEVQANPAVPKDAIYLLSPRREIVPGVLEPEEEWAKRCAVIRNVGAPE